MEVNTGGQRKAAYNSTYTQVGVQCFYKSEVLNPSSVLLMKFSAKNPHLRVAAKRQAVKKLSFLLKNIISQSNNFVLSEATF
jgi:hypothetical protein